MNIRDKFKIFQLVEVIVWLLILSCLLMGIKNYRYKKHSELKKYQIFMRDVDGLISGSPVRMMGVQIGYVESVNIVGDEVYVKFVLTQKDVTFPKGVIATVEFTGMAGSKSLEIYPPDSVSTASNKLIVPQRPKRLNDALGLLCDMFNQLGAMIQRGAYFSEEVSKFLPEPKPSTINDGDDKIKNMNNFLDDLSRKRTDFMEKAKKGVKNEPEKD